MARIYDLEQNFENAKNNACIFERDVLYCRKYEK